MNSSEYVWNLLPAHMAESQLSDDLQLLSAVKPILDSTPVEEYPDALWRELDFIVKRRKDNTMTGVWTVLIFIAIISSMAPWIYYTSITRSDLNPSEQPSMIFYTMISLVSVLGLFYSIYETLKLTTDWFDPIEPPPLDRTALAVILVQNPTSLFQFYCPRYHRHSTAKGAAICRFNYALIQEMERLKQCHIRNELPKEPFLFIPENVDVLPYNLVIPKFMPRVFDRIPPQYMPMATLRALHWSNLSEYTVKLEDNIKSSLAADFRKLYLDNSPNWQRNVKGS